MALRDLPDVFTIPEAAALLRIGRNTAYEQARIWRATGGQEGLPVLTLGSRLLVSKAQLERMLGMESAEGNDDAVGTAGEAGTPSGSEAAVPGDTEHCPAPARPGRSGAGSSPRAHPPTTPTEPTQLTLFNPESRPSSPPDSP